MWLIVLLIGSVILFLFICFVISEDRKEKQRHQKAEKEYLEKNPIPYEINQVVPDLLYLVSLKLPIPQDLIYWPFLKQGIKELQKKFEIIFVEHQFSHDNTNTLPSVYVVFVRPKNQGNAEQDNLRKENQLLYQITSIIPGALFLVSLKQPLPEKNILTTPILDEGVETLKEKFEVIHVRYKSSNNSEFGSRIVYFVFTKDKKK